MTPALWVVKKELVANLKSRWIPIMSAACALLAWLIGGYGFAFAGGQVGARSVLVSLLHLQLYLTPLLGLLLAYDSIQSERDSRMLDVHLAAGVGHWSLLAGKWVGLLACLTVTLAPSVAVQAWVFHAAGGSAGDFLVLLLCCALLAAALVSLGLWLSCRSTDRGTAVSLCVGAWILLAVVADLAVIAMLTATGGDVADEVVNGLILANPLGSYRLLAYDLLFPGQVESLLQARDASTLVALATLVAWVVVPFGVTGRRLGRLYGRLPIVAEPA